MRPDDVRRAESVRVAYPLFQAGGGGSTPTSALDLWFDAVPLAAAKRLNRLWHSRLPEFGRPTCRVAYAAESGGLYVLDEPTTGLHLADVEQLLGLLDRLVDSGKSVIVIEHHQAVMAHADWLIDLGPGAGHEGGQVVFEGTPAQLVAQRSTLTGEHLADYVADR